MLVLLAGTAGAWLVAADLRLGTYRCHRRRRSTFGFRLGVGLVQRRNLGVLELHALRQLLGLAAQASLFLDRVFATHLDVGQHTNGVALDGFEQILEEGEGLALVFLLGVLLGVATQMDAVTQMIHGR